MNQNLFRHYGSALQEQSKDLRKNMTEPERKLWFCFLKEQKPKFSCQKIIGPYIVDFYCAQLQLAIELDGSQHYTLEGMVRDEERTAFLEANGIMVLRFSNADVMKNLRGVCEQIDLTVKEYLLRQRKNEGGNT